MAASAGARARNFRYSVQVGCRFVSWPARLQTRGQFTLDWSTPHFFGQRLREDIFFLTDSSVSSNKRNTDNIKLEIKVINRVSQKGLSLVSRIEPESSGNG